MEISDGCDGSWRRSQEVAITSKNQAIMYERRISGGLVLTYLWTGAMSQTRASMLNLSRHIPVLPNPYTVCEDGPPARGSFWRDRKRRAVSCSSGQSCDKVCLWMRICRISVTGRGGVTFNSTTNGDHGASAHKSVYESQKDHKQ